MAEVWYATREQVKSAMDLAEPARMNARVDAAIGASTRSINGLTRRHFYPLTGTRSFDWPNEAARGVPSWRLWLESNELISLTSLVAGGVTIPPSNYILRRSDDEATPPYNYVEINISTSSVFAPGATWQQAIVATGVFGHRADETAGGTLATAIATTSATTVTLSDSYSVGVGSLLRVDTERMIVTGKNLTTTGVTLTGNPTSSNADTAVAVSSGAGIVAGETVTVDAERMRVDDIAGNTLIVKRAVDGSTLAAHTAGATLFAPRLATVSRGEVGTTAATHLISAPIAVHLVPSLVNSLCVAQAIVQLAQEISGYARTVGQGVGTREARGPGLADLRRQVLAEYGRQARAGAI